MAESDFNLFILNTTTLGDQGRPSVAVLDNGNTVVVWDSGDVPLEQFGTHNDDLKASIFDPSGNRVVGEFAIETNSNGRNVGATVVTLSDGNFAVSWQTNSDTPVARIFNSAGVAQTPEFALSASGFPYGSPTIAPLANGGFIATWWAFDGTDQIAGRVFDANGNPVGNQFVVADVSGPSGIGSPVVTELSGGKLMVVWEDINAIEIKGRVLDSTGSALTDTFDVSEAPPTISDNFLIMPQLTELANGTIAIAWNDGYNNKVRILDASGNEVVSEFQANVYGAEFQNQSWAPDILSLADGGFVVVWSNGAVGIRARVFNADGSERVPEFDVSADIDGQFEDRVKAVQLDNGKVMLVWVEMTEGGDGSGSAIEGRIVNLPSYNYETGQFVSVGSEAVDDINGVLVQDTGQDDLVVALDGNDTVDAGDGNDTIYGDSAPASSAASLSFTLTNEIAASTGKGKDKLYGGAGKDKIYGGGGKDKLKGDDGKDKLFGGKGKDTLIGGKDADKFIFAPHEGKDKVKDFGKGKDKLNLRDFDFDSKADALDAFSGSGKHTTFKSQGTKIVLKGFDHDDLGGSDLII